MSPDRFAQQLDAWLDGSLPAAELAELQAALAEPARQRQFLARCQFEGALRRSGAAAAPAARRPIVLPLAGSLLAAAAVTLLLLPGAPANLAPTAPSERTVTARVEGSGSWAIATQQADGALALTFVPILTTDR